MTDLVISEGYAAAGYEYINVDDCWLDFARSYDGRLQPDAKRFPRGMADLSAYVSIHSKFDNNNITYASLSKLDYHTNSVETR